MPTEKRRMNLMDVWDDLGDIIENASTIDDREAQKRIKAANAISCIARIQLSAVQSQRPDVLKKHFGLISDQSAASA
jgi:hypothetical protein